MQLEVTVLGLSMTNLIQLTLPKATGFYPPKAAEFPLRPLWVCHGSADGRASTRGFLHACKVELPALESRPRLASVTTCMLFVAAVPKEQSVLRKACFIDDIIPLAASFGKYFWLKPN